MFQISNRVSAIQSDTRFLAFVVCRGRLKIFRRPLCFRGFVDKYG
ncbi:hypothetical protein NEISICOT_01932 [Neisseria sicca ATCC 29256]|uniref:Uncharacterized protein n=1 Tax=Neisseria sicca ATCC 29256 TaxID=547045 RepID=C6M5Y2_NEISI|nr:hypothetical protein NEISICOT_01932 [Neisseria sicca ATCC 29256]